jgi:hypothetical protein
MRTTLKKRIVTIAAAFMLTFAFAVPAFAATANDVIGFIQDAVNEGVVDPSAVKQAQDFFANNTATAEQLDTVMGELYAARSIYIAAGAPGLSGLSADQHDQIAGHAAAAAAALGVTATFYQDGSFHISDGAGRDYVIDGSDSPYQAQTGMDLTLPVAAVVGIVALLGGSYLVARKKGLLAA